MISLLTELPICLDRVSTEMSHLRCWRLLPKSGSETGQRGERRGAGGGAGAGLLKARSFYKSKRRQRRNAKPWFPLLKIFASLPLCVFALKFVLIREIRVGLPAVLVLVY